MIITTTTSTKITAITINTIMIILKKKTEK